LLDSVYYYSGLLQIIIKGQQSPIEAIQSVWLDVIIDSCTWSV